MKTSWTILSVVVAVVLAGCDAEEAEEKDMQECAYPEGEISPTEYSEGVRCDAGLVAIMPASIKHPCTPEEDHCENGCSLYMMCSFPPIQCSPCGNGICECEYGENWCNCEEDCD